MSYHFRKERLFRCSYCNNVSNEEICTDVFELDQRLHFRVDPRDKTKIICSKCEDIVDEALRDFNEPKVDVEEILKEIEEDKVT